MLNRLLHSHFRSFSVRRLKRNFRELSAEARHVPIIIGANAGQQGRADRRTQSLRRPEQPRRFLALRLHRSQTGQTLQTLGDLQSRANRLRYTQTLPKKRYGSLNVVLMARDDPQAEQGTRNSQSVTYSSK